MGDEVLEESEMDPFVEEVEKFVSGKTIALFGSFFLAWPADELHSSAGFLIESVNSAKSTYFY